MPASVNNALGPAAGRTDSVGTGRMRGKHQPFFGLGAEDIRPVRTGTGGRRCYERGDDGAGFSAFVRRREAPVKIPDRTVRPVRFSAGSRS